MPAPPGSGLRDTIADTLDGTNSTPDPSDIARGRRSGSDAGLPRGHLADFQLRPTEAVRAAAKSRPKAAPTNSLGPVVPLVPLLTASPGCQNTTKRRVSNASTDATL